MGQADELAWVPHDSVGFIHIRMRDIWKSEQFIEVRKLVEKAGPEALAALDSGFVPAPSSLDRLTIVFLKTNALPRGGPALGADLIPGGLDLPFPVPAELSGAVVILTFTAPYDAAKFRNTDMPNAGSKNANGKDYWSDDAQDLAAYFPNDSAMVLGSAAGVAEFVKKQTADGKQPDGPLTAALQLAAKGGRHVMAALNLKQSGLLNDLRFDQIPEDARELLPHLIALSRAESVAVGLAFTDEDSRLDIRASYKNEADATAAENGVKPVTAYLRTKLDDPKKSLQELLKGEPGQPTPRPTRELPQAALALAGLGALNRLDDYLANPPVKREGMELVATIEMPGTGGTLLAAAPVAVGLLLPSVQKVREAAQRMSGINNLKMMGLGMHSYHDAYNHLPQPGTLDKKPKAGEFGPGLSWRVHLLPYLDEDELYKLFNFNEPWDGPTNKLLIERMPKIYVSPMAVAPAGQTFYKSFVGNGAIMEPGEKTRFSSVTDGLSNTLLVIDGGAPVIWTKPDDVAFTKDLKPMDLALLGNPRVNVLLGDGSVRTIDLSKMSKEVLDAMITRAGGEVVNLDGDRPTPPAPQLGPPKIPDQEKKLPPK